MKKIIVEKTEGIAEIIDRILNEPDKEITVVVPKGSVLGKSVRNFHLLKRETDSAHRKIIVESVDETVLAFAKESGVEASHPLWHGLRSGGGALSDIVRREPEEEQRRGKKKEEPEEKEELIEEEEIEEQVAVAVRSEEAADEDEEGENEDEEEEVRPAKRFFHERKPPAARYDDDDDEDEDDGRERRSIPKGWVVSAGIVVLVAAVAFVTMSFFFDHADVSINFKKTPWSYSGGFGADKSISAVNTSTGSVIVPAQVFTTSKDVTESFPATGTATPSGSGASAAAAGTKAKGTITIYNDYSAAPQELVATTRFITPDGKIFRLVNGATVPGAKTVSGKLTPSSIDAAIVADQPGAQYNVSNVPHLDIPGFQGTPKFAGFYGVIKGSTTGGGTTAAAAKTPGAKMVPTATDIQNAKTKVTSDLQAALQGMLAGSYPNNFKIPDGATKIQITKLSVSTTTDENGNFAVFGEASLQAIGLDEASLKNYLLSMAENGGQQNMAWSSLDLSYSNVQADFTNGRLVFSLAAQGSLEPAFSADDFRTSILGKNIGAAKSDILSLGGLADGKISVWPFWLWNIPSDPKKVHITAD